MQDIFSRAARVWRVILEEAFSTGCPPYRPNSFGANLRSFLMVSLEKDAREVGRREAARCRVMHEGGGHEFVLFVLFQRRRKYPAA